MAVDRRVQRTRTALYDALVKLIREKDYDAISVEDILHAANVGRSTFYSHFTSKDDLLARSLDRLKAMLGDVAAAAEASNADADAATRRVSRALFAHIAEYRDIQLLLAGGRGGVILDKALSKSLASVVRDLPMGTPAGLSRELAVEFVVACFSTVLHWWLERQPAMGPDEVDALFLRLVNKGLG